MRHERNDFLSKLLKFNPHILYSYSTIQYIVNDKTQIVTFFKLNLKILTNKIKFSNFHQLYANFQRIFILFIILASFYIFDFLPKCLNVWLKFLKKYFLKIFTINLSHYLVLSKFQNS